ncbi:DDE_3 domain-containing protein [Trichonephila clavipes]|nr:DDE_3 domain-containing protein [Trichonephila clavipes]
MTGHIYRDVILEQHVRLFWGAMGAEFLFMDDNARPHRVNIVDECLQSGDITRMDWPAYSPDLNPIEHVWDMLDRQIAARQTPPTCLLELWSALLDEWCNIPQDQIDNLILSMPRHYKFDDDIQKVTPARAPLAFSLLSNSALMSKSFSFDLLRLRAKTAWLWLPQSASLTVRCPQRYVHRDQRRI